MVALIPYRAREWKLLAVTFLYAEDRSRRRPAAPPRSSSSSPATSDRGSICDLCFLSGLPRALRDRPRPSPSVCCFFADTTLICVSNDKICFHAGFQLTGLNSDDVSLGIPPACLGRDMAPSLIFRTLSPICILSVVGYYFASAVI